MQQYPVEWELGMCTSDRCDDTTRHDMTWHDMIVCDNALNIVGM